MAVDISNLQEYSDDELLKAARYALANNMMQTAISHNGKSFAFTSIKDCMEIIDRLEEKIEKGNKGSGGFARIRFINT